MAVEPQKPKSRKKQQIEPLDWSTMSQSPALKGMVSFLEVTPEDIRRQQGHNGDSRLPNDVSIERDSRIGSSNQSHSPFPTVSESHIQSEAWIGSDTPTGPDGGRLLYSDGGTYSRAGLNKQQRSEASIGGETHTVTGSRIGSDTRIGGAQSSAPQEKTLGSTDGVDEEYFAQEIFNTEELEHVGAGHFLKESSSPLRDPGTDSGSHSVSEMHTDKAKAKSEAYPVSESTTGSETVTGDDTPIGSEPVGAKPSRKEGFSSTTSTELAFWRDTRIGLLPMIESRTVDQKKQTYIVGPDQYPRPQRRMAMLQGEVVWQNRKIRKCVLAQDAHSQGEDALFSAMWNASKPEAADPSGSRTLRIGYAELAQRSRMHRSNIRINIAGLRAKLAIEVLDEHDSREVMPRLYRLYSYKEILERRRAAGLEYVIRKKSVVFVTETGELVALPGLAKTGVRKTQKRSVESNAEESANLPAHNARAEQLDLDVRQISEAMSQHWPVDEAAAQQLLRQCRSVRRDAEIGEIVFFVNEKLLIALTNKNIKNPTGLILATVPQCFEGVTFQEFRRRRNESLRLAAEEQERKRQQERDLNAWFDAKMRELTALADDESQPQAAREKARRELKHYGG